MTLPGRNLFPGWLSLEMTGGTSSTLSQGVTVAAGPRWPRFLPGARQEPAAEPALPHSFPVFPTACGFPGTGQGHRALQPGTAGVKLLVCKCCQSQAGAARKTSCLLQPVLGHIGNGYPRTVALPSTAPSVGKWDKICLCIPRASPIHPSIPTLIPRAGGSRCSSPWRALPAPPGHTEGQRLGPRPALPTCAPFSERSPAHTDYSGCGFPQRLLPEQHLPCSHQDVAGL